jgi:ATP-dependent RNA helicase RhlE
MSFSTLGLSDALLRAVADEGYTVPTPIQMQAIPAVLAGGDLLAGAQTGTGKTAGFVLPMLQRLSTSVSPYAAGPRKPLRALILTPTRELAAQVEASIKTYGRHLKLTSTVLFGGVGLGPQTAQLRRGVDILVATPGRLLDHHGQGNVDFSRIEIFVLDEADRMLDMGFIPDVKRVLALLPKQRQNLLFSATFSAEIKALAEKLLNRPRTIEATPPNSTVDAIAQRVHPVNRDDKSKLLAWLVKHHSWQRVLVFTRTKHGADKLVRSLHGDGIGAVALHGNKSQNARTRSLADFKAGTVAVMVATDIAARGIDIDQLPHVVNYDLPNVPHDYVHRIGRTGRAGADGEAISLVCVDEHVFLRDIERLIRRTIPRQVVPGFEPDPNAIAQTVFTQRGRGQGQGQRPGAPNARDRGTASATGRYPQPGQTPVHKQGQRHGRGQPQPDRQVRKSGRGDDAGDGHAHGRTGRGVPGHAPSQSRFANSPHSRPLPGATSDAEVTPALMRPYSRAKH